jgi:hypothetical protein
VHDLQQIDFDAPGYLRVFRTFVYRGDNWPERRSATLCDHLCEVFNYRELVSRSSFQILYLARHIHFSKLSQLKFARLVEKAPITRVHHRIAVYHRETRTERYQVYTDIPHAYSAPYGHLELFGGATH